VNPMEHEATVVRVILGEVRAVFSRNDRTGLQILDKEIIDEN